MFLTLLIVVNAAALTSPSVQHQQPVVMVVSWYNFDGHATASGKRFSDSDREKAKHVAAHKSLPFGSRLRLTNPDNGRKLEVVVFDRGPFIRGRSLDVAKAAADALGFTSKGVAKLRVEIISLPNPSSPL